jgi:hypothetical protein
VHQPPHALEGITGGAAGLAVGELLERQLVFDKPLQSAAVAVQRVRSELHIALRIDGRHFFQVFHKARPAPAAPLARETKSCATRAGASDVQPRQPARRRPQSVGSQRLEFGKRPQFGLARRMSDMARCLGKPRFPHHFALVGAAQRLPVGRAVGSQGGETQSAPLVRRRKGS